jgi:hypothetical protein
MMGAKYCCGAFLRCLFALLHGDTIVVFLLF